MADARMQITIDGKTTGAINATKQTQSAITGLSNTLKGLAIGGGALFLAKKGFDLLSEAVKGTVKFLGQCIEEAGNSEVQLTKLNTALKSTGNFTEEGSKALVDYAASLQAMTAFEDDAIVSVEAMLATFKLTPEEIKVATQATLDLASATGQDLQSAAILMGKAFVGETGMLKRYGIMVDENKLKTEGWKAVINEINTEFGGQAAAQGETYAGMLERMKNNLGDLRETIGEAFLPTLKELLDTFTTRKDAVDEFGNVIGQMKSPLDNVKEAITNLAGKIENFLGIITSADYTEVKEGLKGIGESIGFINAEPGLDKATTKFQSFIDVLGKGLQIISGVVDAFVFMANVVGILADTIDMITPGSKAGKGIIDTFKFLTGETEKNTQTVWDNNMAIMGWQESADSMKERIENITNLWNIHKDSNKAANDILDQTTTSAQNAETAVDGLSRGLDNTAESSVNAETAMIGLWDQINAAAESASNAAKQVKWLQERMDSLESKEITITTKFQEYKVSKWIDRVYANGGIIGSSISHAAGGMVVPQSGREVPIIAHEGEIILNNSQQGNIAEAIWGIANGKIGAGKSNQPIYITNQIELDGSVIYQKTSEYLYKNGQTTRIGAGIR